MLLLNTRGYKHPITPRSTGHPFFGTDNSQTEGNVSSTLHKGEHGTATLCSSLPTPNSLHPKVALGAHHPATQLQPGSCQDPPSTQFTAAGVASGSTLPNLSWGITLSSPCPTSFSHKQHPYTGGRRREHFFQQPRLSRGVIRAHMQPNHRYLQQFTASGISLLLPLGTALYPHSQGSNVILFQEVSR